MKPQSHIHGTTSGTQPYMAPEASDGQIYGLPADIFSLAIIMWEMWYGRKVPINFNPCNILLEVIFQLYDRNTYVFRF